MPRRSARAAARLRAADEAFDLISLLARLPQAHSEGQNEEAAALFHDDQSDRVGDQIAEGTGEWDRTRRRRALAMLTDGEIRSARDYHHAAMVFQHAGTLEYLQLGHELARRAAAAGDRPSAWLAAAAHDRWLMYAGLPQKYGTQYTTSGERWVLYRVDPATTDAERANHDVPPLAEALRRADEMNEEWAHPTYDPDLQLALQFASGELDTALIPRMITDASIEATPPTGTIEITGNPSCPDRQSDTDAPDRARDW